MGGLGGGLGACAGVRAVGGVGVLWGAGWFGMWVLSWLGWLSCSTWFVPSMLVTGGVVVWGGWGGEEGEVGIGVIVVFVMWGG